MTFEEKFDAWTVILADKMLIDPEMAIEDALGFTVMTLLRAAYLHPEWLQGVMHEAEEMWIGHPEHEVLATRLGPESLPVGELP